MEGTKNANNSMDMKRDEMNSKELKEFGTKEEFWKAVKEAEINRT